MANISLAVPRHRWVHVLREVHRVLAPGGRFEFIDDELIFPHHADAAAHAIPNFDGVTSLPTRRRAIRRRRRRSSCQLSPEEEWARSSRQSQALEFLYLDMLEKRDIHPRPHLLLEDIISGVFDCKSFQPAKQFRLAVRTPFGAQTAKSTPYLTPASPLLTSDPTQLVVYDGKSTHELPATAEEIEDYACRSLHYLLESRMSLEEYLTEQRDEDGQRVVRDEDLTGAFWNYEWYGLTVMTRTSLG
jgi:hypothetical protein